MSLDDTIRCYRALKDRGIRLGTKAADHCATAQALIDGIPQLIAIAEAAEDILLCGDLDLREPKAERDRRLACLRDAMFPSNAKADPQPDNDCPTAKEVDGRSASGVLLDGGGV